ncbi:MAG: hypothetical protein JXR76_31015 [Deltaproteobacteria bacterium]|nr:hypothetical protein [Deltaproteobacteria bacterium]
MRIKNRLTELLIACILTFSTAVFAQENVPQPPSGNAEAIPSADAAPATSSTATTQSACIPKCRSGYICHAGMCIPACNPPCGQGFLCTADGECVAQQQAVMTPAIAPPPPSPHLVARQQARERKLRIRQQRLDEVKKIRIGIHMDWQWAFSEIYRAGFMGNLGFQKNIGNSFALRARMGGMLGYARPHMFSTADKTGCWAANVDIAPLFGPLGSFYIGPSFWFTYYWHNKNKLKNSDFDIYDTEEYEKANNGPIGGLALDMGVITGEKGNLGINWRIKTALFNEEDDDDTVIIFEFGLAYHFSVSD